MGFDFAALSTFLIPISLAPVAILLWAWAHRRNPRTKKRPFPLLAFAEAKPQTALIVIGTALTVLGEGLRLSLPAAARQAVITFSAIGILTFAAGILTASRGLPRGLRKGLQALAKRLSITPTQLLLLITAALLAALAAMASGDALMMRVPSVALLAWALAAGAAVLGGWPLKQKKFVISRNALIWAAALALVALVLRGWDTTHIPNTLTGDEASGGLFAVEYLKGTVNNVLGFGWYSFPALYFYFQALSISVLGQTTAALRVTSALGGALTVGAIYLAGRALYSHRAGLLGAIFLAGLHFHIHFSRIGLNNIWDGFWFTVIIGLLWWAWKKELRVGFLLAGLALGFSQYFYVSVRLLFILIPVWLLLAALADRARFKRNWTSIVLMFLVAIVVFLPLAANYARHWDEFMAPMQRVSILGDWLRNEQQITGQPAWRILAHQLWLSIQAYTNTDLRHWYTPEVPMLRSFAAGFFLLGIVLLITEWHKPQHWLLALWLGAFTLSGALSESTPAAQRYIGVAPAAALVLGYGLSAISERLAGLWPTAKKTLPALAIALTVLLSISDINFYFRDFTPRGEYGGPNNAVAQHLADYLQTQLAGIQVAFFGLPRMGYLSISSLPYLAPEAEGVDMEQPLGSPENPQLDAGLTVFVFLPEHEADVETLLATYPQAIVQKEFDMGGNLLYWYVELANYPNS
jgi:4-amino-4-deoxy-L-arabinose transferase-like glycosyltransferase